MTLEGSIIQRLKEIVGQSNVLTDVEDIYVYNYEQLLKKPCYPRLDIIARVTSSKQAHEIIELANSQQIQVFKRSETGDRFGTFQPQSTPTILIDDLKQPELCSPSEETEKSLQIAEFEGEIHRTGHGTPRNFALALKSFLLGLPAQKCLNCQTCTGYCTVSTAFNGIETWSSKGRTTLTRALMNGDLKPSAKLTDVLHTCSLCGLCFAECFESTQVRKAIMAARNHLAQTNQMPEVLTTTARNILQGGDPSGMPPQKRVAWTQQLPSREFRSEKAEVLYWVGCVVSTRTPNVAKALNNILAQANVNFALLGENEGCCGYVLLASGLWNEAKENANKLVERITDTHAETLVTPCAGCYYTFRKLYPEILDIELPCKPVHATQYLEGLVKDGSVELHNLDWKVTYHDPCSLGRHSNVYEPPRTVLKAIPELDLVETSLNRNRSRCCGAGGGLWSYNNSVASSSAMQKLVVDVAPLQVSGLITACPTCHINLRNASMRKPMGVRVYDVVEVVEAASSKHA
jgi:glycolate oxidase